MKIEEFVLIDGWLFVEKEGQSDNPRTIFIGDDFRMHSLSQATHIADEYRKTHRIQPERLNPEDHIEDTIDMICDSLSNANR